MTFKEYGEWCNHRACDGGGWGLHEAQVCINIYCEIKKLPFWKREKTWRDKYAKQVYEEIIEPINERLKLDFYAH